MNYYNPYYMMTPYTSLATAPARGGLLSNLIGGIRGISWGSILNNTQRTLGIINQAIPVVKQVTPVMKNAKTMFRVMNEFKKVDEQPTNRSNQTVTTENEVQNENNYTPNTQTAIQYTNEPTFFI